MTNYKFTLQNTIYQKVLMVWSSFKVTVVDDNALDAPEIGFCTPAGQFRASADGFWVLLAPNSLTLGDHEISVKGFVPVT